VSARSPFQGFIGSAFRAQSPRFDVQELWNWYLERADSPSSKSSQHLLPCPGFEQFALLPKSPVRGLFAQNNRLFAVGGDTLYELSRDGGITERKSTALGAMSSPTVTNSPLAPALGFTASLVVTHGGALGSTTYGYSITSTNAYGETIGCPWATSPYGNATLSPTNWNIISWSAVEGATGYKVYRTIGGPTPPQMIAIVKSTTLVYSDVGNPGINIGTPPANTTGQPTGTARYGYKIVATLGIAQTGASAEGVTNTSQSTLSSTSYNTIAWPPVPNATGYKVYRTTGGTLTPPRLLATLTGNDSVTYNDIGDDGDPEIPNAANTTGTFTLFDDGTPVQFASSGDAGNQMLLISGGTAYCYALDTDVLAPVVNGATFGGYIDSYFVVLDAGSSTLKVSESLDGFHWDGTQVYQRARAGDKWLAMAVTFNEIWLIGSQTGEVWTGTGDTVSRFTPYTPVFLETGIIASATLTRISAGQALMWVAQDKDGAGYVVRTDGYTPTKVSTIAVDHSIQNLKTIADAAAFSYQQDGHIFYVVTFPTDQATWVYDLTTNEWHRRGYWDPNTRAFTAYRPQCHVFAFGGLGFGKNLIGDRTSGRVCRMHPSICADVDLSLIRRVRVCPHIASLDTEMTFDRLQFDMDIGLGLGVGQADARVPGVVDGVDPTMMVTYSNDGGVTYGHELWRSAGKQGETRIQVAWCRLGTTKNRVFKLVVTDPIPWRLVGAWLEAEGS
jgi:hypothetical protein